MGGLRTLQAFRVAVLGSMVALAAPMAPIAAAAGTSDVSLRGYLAAVACPSAGHCLVSGSADASGRPLVVSIVNGAVAGRSVYSGLTQITGLTCPATGTCYAMALHPASRDVRLLTIAADGKLRRTTALSVPYGATPTALSCTALTECGMVFVTITNSSARVSFGRWSGGGHVSLHTVALRGDTKLGADNRPQSISCAGRVCEVVGFISQESGSETGYTFRAGSSVSAIHYLPQEMDGVSCLSATTCYAVGSGSGAHGVLLTLSSGGVTRTTTTDPQLDAIACTGTTCTAAGETSDQSAGVIEAVSAGTPGEETTDHKVSRYTAVARTGGQYIACGYSTTSSSGSVVTTG